jgi:hypothetical protein
MTIKEVIVGTTESWLCFNGEPELDGINQFLNQRDKIDTIVVKNLNKFELLTRLLSQQLKLIRQN